MSDQEKITYLVETLRNIAQAIDNEAPDLALWRFEGPSNNLRSGMDSSSPRPRELVFREGFHLLRLFDECGEAIGWGESRATEADAIQEGKRAVETKECSSFAVLQVTYNSAEHRARWLPSPKQLQKALEIIRAMESKP